MRHEIWSQLQRWERENLLRQARECQAEEQELKEMRGHQPRWCPECDIDQEIARRERYVNV
jgi:hypothetical protein